MGFQAEWKGCVGTRYKKTWCVRELWVSLVRHKQMMLVLNCLYRSSLLWFLRGCVFHIIGGAIYLSGIDMIHGTPVLDIKPYIAEYDSPQNLIQPLQDFNLQNNQYKSQNTFQSDGKTDHYDQRQLSRCDKPQACSHTKEKPKCEDGTSGTNYMKHDNSTKIQQNSPQPREIAADLGVESRSDQSLSVAEEQIGSNCPGKSFSEEGTEKRLKRGKEAVVAQGNSAEIQPVVRQCPSRMAGAAHCSAVPDWVREAPVAPLEVRFTPHAETDLEHLSSEGEPGTLCLLVWNESFSQIWYFWGQLYRGFVSMTGYTNCRSIQFCLGNSTIWRRAFFSTVSPRHSVKCLLRMAPASWGGAWFRASCQSVTVVPGVFKQRSEAKLCSFYTWIKFFHVLLSD